MREKERGREREREKERERERERERESSDAAWGPEKCRLLLCRHADSDSGRATENGFSVSLRVRKKGDSKADR